MSLSRCPGPEVAGLAFHLRARLFLEVMDDVADAERVRRHQVEPPMHDASYSLSAAAEPTGRDQSTPAYACAAFLAALVATAIMHLATPEPFAFFGWIVALATLVASVGPFASGAELKSKVATGLINLVIGIIIWSLISSSARRSIRRLPALPARSRTDYAELADRAWSAPTRPAIASLPNLGRR